MQKCLEIRISAEPSLGACILIRKFHFIIFTKIPRIEQFMVYVAHEFQFRHHVKVVFKKKIKKARISAPRT